MKALLSAFFLLMFFFGPVQETAALGEETRFRLAVLELDKSTRDREAGFGALARGLRGRTSVKVAPEPVYVPLENKAIFEHPLLFLPVCRDLGPLSGERSALLRRWLESGGLLVVDNCQGRADGEAARWIEREIESLFPRRKPEPLTAEHSLLRSFFLLDRAHGRTNDQADLRGVGEGDRTMIILSPNDMLGALMVDAFGNPIFSVGGRSREMALRQGINTVLYALTLNYKRDQIHIPFILKRRQP